MDRILFDALNFDALDFDALGGFSALELFVVWMTAVFSFLFPYKIIFKWTVFLQVALSRLLTVPVGQGCKACC